MIEDYYKCLEINRDSSPQDIAKAFRRLSLRHHTKLSQEDPKSNQVLFSQIAEAYEVLSDPIKKAFVDRYGQDKLKEGFFEQGEIKGGYRFANNPEEIYNKFFLENNPFTKIYDNDCVQESGSLFSHAFGAQNYEKQIENQNLEVDVECNLVELYNGCQKEVKYDCSILNKDGRTTQLKQQTNNIYIKRGFVNGHLLTYKGKGHQKAGQEPSDLIFRIVEAPNSKFRRDGNDLHHTAQISLINALNADPIEIECLDNRILSISLDKIVSPQYVKIIKGEGMPIFNSSATTSYGDLYIHFDIIFPDQVNQEQKLQLKQLLKQ